MSNYLLKYKGKYRVLPVIDQSTNDFPRDSHGNIEEDLEIYILCKNGSKIEYYGLNESRRDILLAYIPSLGRGRNVKNELEKRGINILFYDESDEEVLFRFNAIDIEIVADTLKAKTGGANISPFSRKNLPKEKVDIPENEMARYKTLVSKLGNTLLIRSFNVSFLNNVLAKKLRQKGKRNLFDYNSDMKNMKLSHDIKGYIFKRVCLMNTWIILKKKSILI